MTKHNWLTVFLIFLGTDLGLLSITGSQRIHLRGGLGLIIDAVLGFLGLGL